MKTPATRTTTAVRMGTIPLMVFLSEIYKYSSRGIIEIIMGHYAIDKIPPQ
jgi:hypothetical protein